MPNYGSQQPMVTTGERVKTHSEPLHSHVKIVYHILKIFFFVKIYVLFLLNAVSWSTFAMNENKDSFEIRIEGAPRKCI